MIMSSIEKEFREMVKDNYDFSSWAGTTKRPEAGLCVNFLIPTTEFQEWNLEEREDLPIFYREKRTVRYIYSLADAEGRVAITVFECDSIREAHEALIDLVMTYTAPYLPKCESKGLDIGDVCFGIHSQLQTSVIFARYNILVRIDSVGTKDIPVEKFAETIDSLIYGKPKESEVKTELEPTILEFGLTSTSTEINGEIIVRVVACDPNDREIMVKILGTGGFISRMGKQYTYHAKEKGKQNIQIFIVNEDGLVSKAVSEITIE